MAARKSAVEIADVNPVHWNAHSCAFVRDSFIEMGRLRPWWKEHRFVHTFVYEINILTILGTTDKNCTMLVPFK